MHHVLCLHENQQNTQQMTTCKYARDINQIIVCMLLFLQRIKTNVLHHIPAKMADYQA